MVCKIRPRQDWIYRSFNATQRTIILKGKTKRISHSQWKKIKIHITQIKTMKLNYQRKRRVILEIIILTTLLKASRSERTLHWMN